MDKSLHTTSFIGHKLLRNRQKNIKIPDSVLILLLSVAFLIFHSNNVFFWDNIVQISISANWYFENNFKYFFLPADLATGHIPVAGLYIGLAYKLFGQTLVTAHFSMLPFIFGIIYQLNILLSTFFKWRYYVLITLLFLLLDPPLLSQMSLVTFEVIMLFFLLLTINSIIRNRKILLALSFTCLLIISLRGTIAGGGVIIFYLAYNMFIIKKGSKINDILIFLPGLIIFIALMLLFYNHYGWVIHNTFSNRWPESGKIVNFQEFIRNILIFGWRLIDFGRIGIWFILLIIIVKLVRRKFTIDRNMKILFLLLISQFIVFFPATILLNNPINHRYLIPFTIPVSIFAIYWTLNFAKHKIRIVSTLLIVLVSGSFWIYPEKIAQGWDSTPAHWPYYKLREEMIEYISNSNISPDSVGSSFPNISSFIS
ncbi:MAG: hypothetical protein K8R35_01705, partial [Bacteroidales bacterium]|nr:hypothetical protein [Bacteroidales bacterium]